MKLSGSCGDRLKAVLTSKRVSADRERVVRCKERCIAIFPLAQFCVAITQLSPIQRLREVIFLRIQNQIYSEIFAYLFTGMVSPRTEEEKEREMKAKAASRSDENIFFELRGIC
jgi:hypothetical protein